MPAKLRITPASSAPFELAIGNTATLGRTKDNTVCLSASPLVSRQHALIRCHDGYQYQIIDLGSRNGTFVNDRRVVMPVTLENGASIRIADNLIVFEQTDDEESGTSLELTMAGSTDGSNSLVQPVALLVCDIRGFSSMAEKISSSKLAHMLGAWFREAGNLVKKHGGTIDKFIGDAILAYWSPCGGGDEVNCDSTLAIGREILALADTMTWANGDPFRVGIALHYGSVTCGNIGLDAQRDATVIGDAVNTVFRLESIMKELNQRLVLSHDFREQLTGNERLTDLGERALKGKQQPVRVYGFGSENPPDSSKRS